MRPRFAGVSSTPRMRVISATEPSKLNRQPTPEYGQIDSPSSDTSPPVASEANGCDIRGRGEHGAQGKRASSQRLEESGCGQLVTKLIEEVAILMPERT